MTDLGAFELAGHPCTGELHVPSTGVWIADIELAEATALTGAQVLMIGGASFTGTIDPEYSGTFAGVACYRLVGGANAWGRKIPAQAYHNDGSLKASRVALDVAKMIGEKIGDFEPDGQLGSDYVRRETAASQALEYCAQGTPWWVDFEGVTQVKARAPYVPDPSKYHVVTYDPITQFATIAIDDPQVIGIGAQLTSDRFTGTLTIREYSISAHGGSIDVHAWLGASADTGHNRIAQLMAAHAKRAIDERLYVRWRYRVDSVSGDGRLNLVAVSDRAPVRMVSNFAPAGVYAEMSPGAVVLLEFLEGNPALPVVSPSCDTRDQFATPKRLTLGGGPKDSDSAADVAFKGAEVDVLLPPAVFVGTVGGAPATGAIIWSAPKTLGMIAVGSTKAGVVL